MIELVLCAVLLFIASLVSIKIAWFLFFVCQWISGVTLPIPEVTFRADLLSGACLLAIVIYNHHIKDRQTHRYSKFATIAMSAWLGWLFITSSLNSPHQAASYWMISQLMIGGLSFLVIVHSSDKKTIIRIGLLVATIFTGSTLGLSVLEAIFAGNNILNSSATRLAGLSFEPNIFSAQAAMWLAVMFYIRHDLARKYAATAVVLLLAVILGQTRSAWVATAIVCIAYIWSKTSKIIATQLTLLTVTMVIWISPEFVLSESTNDFIYRLTHLVDFSEGTGAYRLTIIDWAFADAFESTSRALFGSGVSSFGIFHPIDPTHTQQAYIGSLWVQLIYDSGVFGFLLFLLFFVAAWLGTGAIGRAMPLFLCIGIVSTTTNPIWMAFPWAIMALVQKEFAPPDPAKITEFFQGNRAQVKSKAKVS